MIRPLRTCLVAFLALLTLATGLPATSADPEPGMVIRETYVETFTTHYPVPGCWIDQPCVEAPTQLLNGEDGGFDPLVPNPLGGSVSVGASTTACGNLHVHGSWQGNYYHGTTQGHLHHCGGSPNHWNGWVRYAYYSNDRAPSFAYWGHDGVSVYYNDYRYHYVCYQLQQQDGMWTNWVCYYQYN